MDTLKLSTLLSDVVSTITQLPNSICDIRFSRDNEDITIDIDDMLSDEDKVNLEFELMNVEGVLGVMYTNWANITKPRTSIVVIV